MAVALPCAASGALCWAQSKCHLNSADFGVSAVPRESSSPVPSSVTMGVQVVAGERRGKSCTR